MILVITVNYDNAELTNKTISSIFDNNSHENSVNVIIVDNNSHDRTKLIKDDRVKIIPLEDNIGYFPAINMALRELDVSLYEFIIICNNDLIFDKKFFTKLKETYYQKSIYAVCPRILDLDNVDQNPMLDKGISKFKLFFYDIYYKNYFFGQLLYRTWQIIKKKTIQNNLTERQIFMGYGAIYILTNKFFENNHILESPPFLMFEETFLAYQIYRTNGIEYYDPKLIVHHQDHNTCSKVPKRKMYNICKESYKYFKERILQLPPLQ